MQITQGFWLSFGGLPLAWALLVLIFSPMRYASARSMCSIADQRTAIVGNRFFFSSGNYTFDDDGLPTHNTSSLYWLYLNDTIDVSGPINLDIMGSIDLPSDSLTGGQSPASGGAAGVFFYDYTTLYAYAGLSLIQVEGGKISFGNDSEGQHATDTSTGTSFYTGGWTMDYNGTNNGTVKFQSFNSDAPQWTFETATSGNGIQGPDMLKGAMVYVRKGRAGFSGWPWDQRPFSDVFIYDIFSNAWYQQTATDDLPSLRTEFCAGVSSAPDDSSFQITMHGGWDQFEEQAFNDVYVLSIPSFRWIKVDDSNNPDLLGPDQPGRNRLKCDVWNETSLIVSGGQITYGIGDDHISLSNYCNKTYPPIKVLDTSSYAWRTEFSPSGEYSVPDVVSAIIGGNSSGGASLTAPSSGWSSDEFASIFSQTVPRATSPDGNTDTNQSNTTSPTSAPKNSSAPNGLSAGVIAGIVIGAFVLAVLIAGAIYFFRSKPRSPKSQITMTEPSSNLFFKPELSGTPANRYELSTEPPPREMFVAHWHTVELSAERE
ncbi:hypothetical protein F5Y16DRAFT_409298 [Xylariaceae sp. FL0255]|nr:hypothetical protein F5Y16DRAFT_409298 [Xylariaceae sp. FL0255]